MRSPFIKGILAILVIALWVGFGAWQPTLTAVQAQEPQPTENPLSISNEVCINCHVTPGQTMVLDNGDILDLTVWPEEFPNSIHGTLGYACVQCHRTVGNYPHPPASAASLREFTITMNNTCYTCHEPQLLLAQDSVHAEAFNAGQIQAAVCTDCHGAHTVQQWRDAKSGELLQNARQRIPQTCANCHYEIYQKYLKSVHGSTLYADNNADVPTCIDCHGVHNIQKPNTNAFRLASPQLCAKCHTEPTMMAKYGLSTAVMDTYIDDFHGTTVSVFKEQSPDTATNKPVCYDCHGVHDIRRTDDARLGLQMQENILVRCQICHPEATANFPTAWLSHYIPTPDKNPIVYYVNLFYKFFIPGVLGPMVALVGLDIGHTLFKKYRKKSQLAVVIKPEAIESETQPSLASDSISSPLPAGSIETTAPEAIPETAVETPGESTTEKSLEMPTTPNDLESPLITSEETEAASLQEESSPDPVPPSTPDLTSQSGEEAAHE